MSHDFRADLDQLLPERRQRPVLNRLRQRQGAQEVAEVIGERMELWPEKARTEAGALVSRLVAYSGLPGTRYPNLLVALRPIFCAEPFAAS